MACQGERPRAASTRFLITILWKTIDLESHGRLGRAATIRRDWKIINFQLKSFRRFPFALACFMLALIGLKKFGSFQKPNRIDVLEKKTSVSGPAPEWRGVSRRRGSPGDGSRAGLGAQRRKKGDGKHWI